MVKRQKEKQYQSAREHRSNQQLRKNDGTSNTNTSSHDGNHQKHQQHQLPFTHCPISLLSYEIPVALRCDVMTSDTATSVASSPHQQQQQQQQKYGIIFDLHTLMEFISHYKINPITGEALKNTSSTAPTSSMQLDSSIIHLNMDRVVDEDNDNDVNGAGTIVWQCPILSKPFTERTKVVAIIQHQKEQDQEQDDEDGQGVSITGSRSHNKDRIEANVYSYEAYHELNVKQKQYCDLISGLPFRPSQDVFILYEPYEPATPGTTTSTINHEFHTIRNHRIRNTIRNYRFQPQQSDPNDDDYRFQDTAATGAVVTAAGTSTASSVSSSLYSSSIRHSGTSKTIMAAIQQKQMQMQPKHHRHETEESIPNNSAATSNKKQKVMNGAITTEITITNAPITKATENTNTMNGAKIAKSTATATTSSVSSSTPRIGQYIKQQQKGAASSKNRR